MLPAAVHEAVFANTAKKRILYTPPRDAPGRVEQAAVYLEPGASLEAEVHARMSQQFTVLAGAGRYGYAASATAPMRYVDVTVGDAWVVEPGTSHTLTADWKTPMRLYTTYTPPHDEGEARRS